MLDEPGAYLFHMKNCHLKMLIYFKNLGNFCAPMFTPERRGMSFLKILFRSNSSMMWLSTFKKLVRKDYRE